MDTIEQKKTDNRRNNNGEEAAWDAELIPAIYKRAFINGDDLILVVTRQPGSNQTIHNRWMISSQYSFGHWYKGTKIS